MARVRITKSDMSQHPHESFVKMLKAWKPEHPDHKGWKPKLEYDWQQSLFGHLQDCTDGIVVDKEKGRGRGRGDLTLDYRYLLAKYHHIIELKRGLASMAKVREVRSQVQDYFSKDKADFVFVVICGEPTEERFMRLLIEEFPSAWVKRPGIYWKHLDGKVVVELKPS